MKVSEIVQRVLSSSGKWGAKGQPEPTARLVYSKLCSVRGLLLSQRVRKRQRVGQACWQELPCVELVNAPAHECPCMPSVGCKIKKTKHPLPAPLVGMDRHLLRSVASVDGEVLYSETSFEEKRYNRGNKYTNGKPDWYIRNGHLYITQPTGAKLVTVTGLFGDPLAAMDYPSLCMEKKGCDSRLDREFPMDGDLIDALVEMASAELYGGARPEMGRRDEHRQQEQQQQ